MEKGTTITFMLFICCVIVGCSDYSSNSHLRRRHYSDLIRDYGEPTEVETIGTSGAFINYSPLPLEEARQQQRDYPFMRNVYEVDNQGYVYP